MRALGLHHMSALDVSPPELISLAGELGCQHACVFVRTLDEFPLPRVTPDMVGEMLARMSSTGVTISNIEIFPLDAEVVVNDYRSALDIGADLGGTRIVTTNYDTVVERAAENLAGLSDLAAERGMTVGLEFMGPTPGCSSIQSAVQLIQLADRANAGIAVDCLHLIRTGGTPEDVAAVPTNVFAYAQLCDGADLSVTTDYIPECFDRLVPGDGVFPIAAILDALPEALHLDVEVPSSTDEGNSLPSFERAGRGVDASRKLIERARPTR